MSQYNVFQAIIMSFYSKKLYRDVAQNWGGKAFAYLLLLIVIASIFMTYQVQIFINQMYNKSSGDFVNQIPVITITKGKVSTPEKKPYLIREPHSNNTIGIIDTTGQYTNLDNKDAMILLTEKTIITHHNNETRITTIPENVDGTIDPLVINTYIAKIISFAWIGIFIAICVASYIYRIIQALIYSLIGLLYGSFRKSKLTYGQMVQIALVSITPVIILGAILDSTIGHFPLQILAYFVLGIGYLFYGISANQDE